MGWFLLTVVLPVIAPIGGLLVFWLLPLPAGTKAGLRVVAPFKDGQLCWASMGFCVAGLYEIAEPGVEAHRLEHAVANWSNAGLILLLVFSALLAAGGAAFPTPLQPPSGTKPLAHYATMLASFLLTLLAGIAYTVVHFQVNP